MAQAKEGDLVKVHYTGHFGDGVVFDSSMDGDPLEFMIGSGQVIPGFERAIVGMEPGETKTQRIPASQAYGEHHPEMVLTLDRSQVDASFQPEPGQQVELGDDQGRTFVARVTDVTEEAITLDANHELAGRDLTFELELVDIT